MKQNVQLPSLSEPERVERYLQRIGFTGTLDGSAKTLAQLQQCHLLTVPYENIDILLNVPISLDIGDIYRKIVEDGRGGYCFELNRLFGWLLKQAGYAVTDYGARFWRNETELPPKRRHHVLRAEAEGIAYLCDVGVGGVVPDRPLQIEPGLEQPQGDERYKLERDPTYGWMLLEWKKEQWRPFYSFSEEPQLEPDFVMANFWCQHAPESFFRRDPVVALRTPQGRRTVSGRELRIFENGQVVVQQAKSDAELTEWLDRYFGIRLNGSAVLK